MENKVFLKSSYGPGICINVLVSKCKIEFCNDVSKKLLSSVLFLSKLIFIYLHLRSKSIGTNSINELWRCVEFGFAPETFSDLGGLSPNNLGLRIPKME